VTQSRLWLHGIPAPPDDVIHSFARAKTDCRMNSLTIMKYPGWMKWAIRVGVLLFAACAAFLFYSATKIQGDSTLIVQLALVALGSGVALVTTRGFILLPYLDSTIEFGDEGFSVSQGEVTNTYLWRQSLTIKNYANSQVLRIRDNDGNTILAVDHLIPHYREFVAHTAISDGR